MKKNISNNIINLLSEKKLTQKNLAQASGITESAISHYVHGTRIPNNENLIKIAKALETTTEYLLNQPQKNRKEDDIKVIKKLIKKNINYMTKEDKTELISVIINE